MKIQLRTVRVKRKETLKMKNQRIEGTFQQIIYRKVKPQPASLANFLAENQKCQISIYNNLNQLDHCLMIKETENLIKKLQSTTIIY